MINRRRFLTITAIASTIGFARLTRGMVQWNGTAMGADVSITLYNAEEEQATAALDAARNTIQVMEKLFSLYDRTSEISLLNVDQSRQLPSEFIDLIKIVHVAHNLTEGLFDPTIQSVFAARLIGKQSEQVLPVGSTWRDVEFDDHGVRFLQTNMAITLNGIAQGYATDSVRDTLASYGFSRTLVNIGEFRAGSQQALIGVNGANGELIATEKITDAAIATSSSNGFMFEDGSSHIINPKGDGQPQWASATVVASNAAMADALSTALILANGDHLAKRLVKQHLAHSVLLEDFSRNFVRHS